MHVSIHNAPNRNSPAFVRCWPPRFIFHYTPKAASWLNMIEIEFSALARLCLNRRIPTLEKLEHEVMAIIHERHEKRLKIHWQFTVDTARGKLNSHYRKVNPHNSKYLTT
ncbi:MAG: transposase [Chloroflexi bacterium]|nr:transposase [Chloroflexota bacterium]